MERLVIEVPAELFAPAESSSFDGVFDMGRSIAAPTPTRALNLWNTMFW